MSWLRGLLERWTAGWAPRDRRPFGHALRAAISRQDRVSISLAAYERSFGTRTSNWIEE